MALMRLHYWRDGVISPLKWREGVIWKTAVIVKIEYLRCDFWFYDSISWYVMLNLNKNHVFLL